MGTKQDTLSLERSPSLPVPYKTGTGKAYHHNQERDTICRHHTAMFAVDLQGMKASESRSMMDQNYISRSARKVCCGVQRPAQPFFHGSYLLNVVRVC